MKRWSLGLLVSGFFAGVAFILTAVVQNIFRIYRHATGRAGYTIAMTVGALVGITALAFWVRATRPD